MLDDQETALTSGIDRARWGDVHRSNNARLAAAQTMVFRRRQFRPVAINVSCLQPQSA